jgi:hypothetical protein
MTPAAEKEMREAYELLDGLALLKRKQQQEEDAPQVVCAWCSVVKREGSLPASHGICDSCSEREFGGYIIGVIARSALPPEPRHVRWVHLWPFWSFLLAALLLCAQGVAAQVTATAVLRDGVAELRVGNPTATPMSIDIALFRDATKADGPVTLGDSVSALISPHAFTLQPGTVQVVRVRVREAVKPNEMLRLATMFTPIEATGEQVGSMRLLIRTRLITRVLAVGP